MGPNRNWACERRWCDLVELAWAMIFSRPSPAPLRSSAVSHVRNVARLAAGRWPAVAAVTAGDAMWEPLAQPIVLDCFRCDQRWS